MASEEPSIDAAADGGDPWPTKPSEVDAAARIQDALDQAELVAEKRKWRRPDVEDDDHLNRPNQRRKSTNSSDRPSSTLEHDEKEKQKSFSFVIRSPRPGEEVSPRSTDGLQQRPVVGGSEEEMSLKKSLTQVVGIGAIQVTGPPSTTTDAQQPHQRQGKLQKQNSLLKYLMDAPHLQPQQQQQPQQGEDNNNDNNTPALQQQQKQSAAGGAATDAAPTNGQPSPQPGAIAIAGMGLSPSPLAAASYEFSIEDAPPAPPLTPMNSNGSEVVAQAVTRDDLEQEIQQRIIAQATVGEVVVVNQEEEKKKSTQQIRKERCLIGLIVGLATVCLVTFLAVFLGTKQKQQEQAAAVDQEALQTFLVMASLEAFDDTDDAARLKLFIPDSAQSQAYEWLMNNLDAFPFNNDNAIQEEEQLLETYALATLFFGTGGNQTWDTTNPELGLESWMGGTDACVWLPNPDLDCNNGFVQRLALAKVNMTNSLPQELLFLRALIELNVAENQLTGSLPTDLPSSLQTLQLDGNQFDGEIPMEMTQLHNLTFLSLRQNQKLMASLPGDVMAAWSNLQTLQLDQTKIQGTIPNTIGLMTSLVEFSAEQVRLSGEIPTQIGLCQSLRTFHIPQYNDLSSNITGKLPKELWAITTLESIDTTYVGLSFTIPADHMEGLGSSLRVLKVGTTRIQGTLPTQIGLLSSLEILEMDNSAMIGGTIPSEIGMMESLKMIDLSRDPVMVGGVPTEIGNLRNLEKLWLFSSSSFNESLLPSEIGLCTNLQSLNMKGAEISTGPIPTEIGLLSKLVDLELLRTNMTGSIPSEIGLLQNFEVLTLGGKGITGTLPTELAQAASMTKILVAGTNVGGTIPAQYGALRHMDKLAVNDNNLTGTLPKSLAGWNKLDSFSINGNQITGTFPKDYSNWIYVTRVTIYDTNLTGELGQYTCNGWGDDHEVQADCDEIDCDDCCTHCCDGGDCRPVDGEEDGKKTGKGNKTPNFFPPIRQRNRIRGRVRG